MIINIQLKNRFPLMFSPIDKFITGLHRFEKKRLGPIPDYPALAFQSGKDSYVSRAAPWVGWGSCLQSIQSLNTEDGKERGVWSTLAMEEGTCWYVGE